MSRTNACSKKLTSKCNGSSSNCRLPSTRTRNVGSSYRCIFSRAWTTRASIRTYGMRITPIHSWIFFKSMTPLISCWGLSSREKSHAYRNQNCSLKWPLHSSSPLPYFQSTLGIPHSQSWTSLKRRRVLRSLTSKYGDLTCIKTRYTIRTSGQVSTRSECMASISIISRRVTHWFLYRPRSTLGTSSGSSMVISDFSRTYSI